GGRSKAPVPTDLFAQGATHEGADKSAEINAHVENGESAIAARVVGLVELSHHDRHAWLEVAGADDDEDQAADKGGHTQVIVRQVSQARDPQDDMPQGNQD